ncbi:High-affinity methionine permease [Cyphellophora attinorum]|uniref:High-affinity methionine permease n=1 Tax=Cyphellophora attinorum TaxID=1664694 RepID=A0A0N0NRR5_9EURO|nr:High-affinity methionine permease [Phialophora attinorum]KPI45401.1 High-affinity methionine permease [Phialophora attinorum]
MALTAHEEALLERPTIEAIEHGHQRLEDAPSKPRLIGKYTIVALILNRTIGSGIFLTPHRVLAGTGCVGGALFLWALGALLSLCGLYVWLECGLSMPRQHIPGEEEPRGVPRSGGEKNFLEFMFPNSGLRLDHVRTTCSFSIMFILLYNLSGNAISFAIMIMTASGIYDPNGVEAPDQGKAVGIACGALSIVVLLHMSSRRGGIWVNNTLAAVKVALLLAIICLGIAKATGRFPNPEGNSNAEVIRHNFRRDVWKTQRNDVASWSSSLMLCVNISYLLVVDKDLVLNDATYKSDLASLFFRNLFHGNNEQATKAMAALIALSIFGNLIVMTFTAARVKQEIAKEGILPWSLYIATSYTTPYGYYQRWTSRRQLAEHEIEHAPTAAFLLHWFTSVLLIVVTLPVRDPRYAYSALVTLYTYTIVGLLGFWVSAGLLYINLRRDKWHWKEKRRFKPWLSPLQPAVYALASAFMLITAFIPPKPGSPFHRSVTGISWYIVPTIGLSGPLWGVLYYWGLLMYQWKIGKQLEVSRRAYCEKDPDCPTEYVQRAEIIDHTWIITASDQMPDGFAETGKMGHTINLRERRASVSGFVGSDSDSMFGGNNGTGRMADGF